MRIAILLTGLLFASATSLAEEVQPRYERLSAAFDADDAEVRKDACETWQTYCLEVGRPGREDDREAACGAMMSTLEQEPSQSEALFLLRQIERIGRAESVNGLDRLMESSNSIVREAARRALMNNPAPDATGVLHKKLAASTDTSDQIRLIHAVGFRGQGESVAVLEGFLESTDDAVFAAAATAMARIGTPAAAAVLRDTLPQDSERRSRAVATAVLAIADDLRESGDVSAARAAFTRAFELTTTDAVRAAALRGRLLTAGDAAGRELTDAILRGSSLDRQVAIGLIPELPPAAVAEVIKHHDDLPAETRVAIYPALSDRRESACRDLFRQVLAGADDVTVRVAAIAALGSVGDADDVPRLLEWLESEDQQVATAADRTLSQIDGDAASRRLLAALEEASETDEIKKLMDILNRRRVAELAGFAAGVLSAEDVELRKRARNTLSRLGTTDQVGPLVMIADSLPDAEREDAIKAVVTICQRVPDRDGKANPVMELMAKAEPQQRATILAIVGRIGGASAAEFVTARLDSDNADEQDAALAALANWPDASVSNTLLELARTGDSDRIRQRALRGLARVVVLPTSSLTDQQQLQILRDAMQMATRDRDRELILDRAKAIDRIETVRFVRPFLDESQLAGTAGSTIVHLARRKDLRQQYPELNEDLRHVIATTRDERVANRARAILADM